MDLDETQSVDLIWSRMALACYFQCGHELCPSSALSTYEPVSDVATLFTFKPVQELTRLIVHSVHSWSLSLPEKVESRREREIK